MPTTLKRITDIFDPAYDGTRLRSLAMTEDLEVAEDDEPVLLPLLLDMDQDEVERNLMYVITDLADLATAVSSPYFWIRAAVARNEHLDHSLFMLLAHDSNFTVLLQLLLNDAAPLAVLEYLSTYKHEDWRENDKRVNVSRLAQSLLTRRKALSAPVSA